jgi:uncharacterized protein
MKFVTTIVQLGALLHDIADSKFHNGDETIGPRIARNFRIRKVDEEIITHVVNIIENISFKGGISRKIYFDRIEYRSGCGSFRRYWSDWNCETFNYGDLK